MCGAGLLDKGEVSYTNVKRVDGVDKSLRRRLLERESVYYIFVAVRSFKK